MKLFSAAVGVAAILQSAKAQQNATYFESVLSAVFSTSQIDSSSTPTDSPTEHPLKGTPLPKRCENEINNGSGPLSKLCTKWVEINDDFTMPTHSPSESPSSAPSPFFKVESSTFINVDDHPSLVVEIHAVDDTFIELFRSDTPLGDKANVKIDAIGGVPTKVTMLKFNIGETMKQILLTNVGVSLKSAKLQLYARATATTDQFGGYVQEISSDWSEETAVWKDYLKVGPAAKKDAMNLLPSANDTLTSFEGVSPLKWAKADVTERFKEIAAGWSDTASSQFAVRITTDESDGVVYASKEDIQFGPKLVIVFVFDGTAIEVAAAAAAAAASNQGDTTVTSTPTLRATSNPTKAPTSVPSPPPTPLLSSPPTLNPTMATISPVVSTFSPMVSTESPVLSTPSPASSTESPVATTASPFVTTPPPSTSSPVLNTPAPTVNPSQAPSPLSTPSPTNAVVTEEPTETSAIAITTATSVVSQMFQLKITVTTEKVRERNLKGTRELTPFLSADEKERPALEQHLMNVYNESLTSSPEQVEITFVNGDMDVDIVSSSELVRSSKFKISATFIDYRIASIPANEATKVLDQATLHAFTGAQNNAFVSILKKTGEPFINSSEQITVAVSKVSFAIGSSSDQNAQAATATEASVSTRNETSNEEAGWAGPALAISASLVVVASALASFILIRQRRNEHSYDEEHKHANDLMSPTNTEAVTPSPTSLGGRFRKKKKVVDYTEFFEDPEDPSTTLEYDFSPLTRQKLDTEQFADFDCPQDITFSQFQCRSFDDSMVSDVSAHIYAGMAKSAKSPQRNTVADSDKSGIESEQFRFDVLGNDDDLQVDGGAPDFNVDDDSASEGDVPSELYSNMSMDDSTTMQSNDLPAVYGVNAFMLEAMINSKDASFMDMPPPPSDAASENSSQQDFPSDPLEGHDVHHPGTDESYKKAINDELKKVMMILNDGDAAEDDNTVDLGSIGDGDVSADSNVYDVPHLQATSEDADVNDDESVQSFSDLSEDDPVKLMNSALDDCMKILDKARPALT